MNKSLALFLAALLWLSGAIGQQVHTFTNALWAQSPMRYGREALYTDLLAYRMYTQTLSTPVENASINDSDSGVWKKVIADTAGRLIRPGLGRGFGGFGRGGYFYLTYQSKKETTAILNIKGNSGLFLNGEPHAGDPYFSGWLHLPVKLKKGLNEFYVRGNVITASLDFSSKAVMLKVDDPTVPSIRIHEQDKKYKAAVVVINKENHELRSLELQSNIGSKKMITVLPTIPALSTKKVYFDLDASAIQTSGKHDCEISLLAKNKVLDKTSLEMEAVDEQDKYSRTFISDMDGSLQYYAVAPQAGGEKKGSALFLSVHGAGVEAIGQARAYQSKDWGNIVTPTNRRPRGFNWEDWGRIDALEVLDIATKNFQPDPQQVYLTGHSMGGHGTWFLGATYPDKWAAIAPCAGYPTLKGYGSADGLVPDSSNDPMEQTLLRASNQSDVIKLASNYKPLGVYIFHGDSDRVVPVTYARQMKKELAAFHKDFSYYEYPGGEHWFGNHSVDWKPLFDFFQWHKRKPDSLVNHIDFTTANPGISSGYYWASIYQQEEPLAYSNIKLNRNLALNKIEGSSSNVRVLKLDLSGFAANSIVSVNLDGTVLDCPASKENDAVYLERINDKWNIITKPSLQAKGPHRYGTFKDGFNHRMVFVYSTAGNREENAWSYAKARYDAETWYYRGNGAVEIIADKEYNLEKYKDRGVVLYGNKTTNQAWDLLLKNSPIQVERNQISLGEKSWKGDDIAAYFVRPIEGSAIASVSVISGTGIKGMNAATANQYFAGASGFPDYMIFGLDMLKDGVKAVKATGFFDNNWK